MFDWFAAPPPGRERPERDRPTIPLTSDEQQAFDYLCATLRGEPRWISALDGRAARGWLVELALGVALVALGGAWTAAFVTVNVGVAFLGVLVQGVGLLTAVDAASVRARSSGSAAPLEASPPQPDAPRRPGP